MMENKCKDCGCQDCGCKDTFLPVAPCSDPATCPSPQKCEDTFDSACVIYTGLDLKCGDVTVATTNTSLEQVLQNIVDEVCSLQGQAMNITINNYGYDLTAVVSGGKTPYQYLWSIAQGLFVGHEIQNNDYTSPTVYLLSIPGNSLQVGGISGATGAVYMSHIRLDVTDANQAKQTIFYTLTNLE
jgi:hypothetical protein